MKKVLFVLVLVLSLSGCEMYQGTYVSYNIKVREGDLFSGSYINSMQETVHITGETYFNLKEFIPYRQIVGLSAQNLSSNEVTIFIHFKKNNKWASYKHIIGDGLVEAHGVLRY